MLAELEKTTERRLAPEKRGENRRSWVVTATVNYFVQCNDKYSVGLSTGRNLILDGGQYPGLL